MLVLSPINHNLPLPEKLSGSSPSNQLWLWEDFSLQWGLSTLLWLVVEEEGMYECQGQGISHHSGRPGFAGASDLLRSWLEVSWSRQDQTIQYQHPASHLINSSSEHIMIYCEGSHTTDHATTYNLRSVPFQLGEHFIVCDLHHRVHLLTWSLLGLLLLRGPGMEPVRKNDNETSWGSEATLAGIEITFQHSRRPTTWFTTI